MEPYMIFISAQRMTILSRDVKLGGNLASRKSHELPLVVTEDEEHEAPKGEQHVETSTLGIQPLGWEEIIATSSSF